MSVLDLAREDLRGLRRYSPGEYEPESTRLNANESPWRLPSDTTERGLNVYPPPRPAALRTALAGLYGAPEDNLLITRGSSEAIDLLIRGFCNAGRDSIAICPPTFDMYRVYATIQGAGIVPVPLDRDRDFALDEQRLLDSLDPGTKIVFLCSPNNPTGTALPRRQIETICEALTDRALVVIDEAYFEFADGQDCLDLQQRFEHVVLLRTLSKFVALAGARCGALIAAPDVIGFLDSVLPPYTFPTPSIELVVAALQEQSLVVARERIELIRRERRNLSEALENLPQVRRVYPSQANFVLVEVHDRRRFVDSAKRAKILIREFEGDPLLDDCVRITVGRPEDNDRLVKALGAGGQSVGP